MNQYDENKKRQGLWLTYFENGKIWHERNFLNNQLHNLRKYYDKTGKENYAANLIHGELEGELVRVNLKVNL
jgi:antitoxin component YwqK of YwqJK toxin-antitoxin module